MAVAGMAFTWDPRKKAGKRVVSVQIFQGGDKNKPTKLDEKKSYTVTTFGWISQGRDGFDCFLDEKSVRTLTAPV